MYRIPFIHAKYILLKGSMEVNIDEIFLRYDTKAKIIALIKYTLCISLLKISKKLKKKNIEIYEEVPKKTRII